MMILRFLFTICALIFSLEAADPTVFALTGHLGEDDLSSVKTQIEEARAVSDPTIVIEVNSSSGDLTHVLDLAKQLYQLKLENNAKIILYINDNAVGPAAILPFLADELYISYFVSWGDIPLGTETSLPTNILRSRVRSLINANAQNTQLLRLIAEGMADPSLVIIDDGGWKIGDPAKGRLISSKEEALVLNQNQLRQLQLVKGVQSQSNFRKQFIPSAPTDATAQLVIPKKGLDARLSQAIQTEVAGPNRIGYISIKEKSQITQATWIYIKNAVDYYKEKKPAFIILELDTPGGEVFSSQKISDALKELDTQYDIPVVAFINNWAISAGAMLAYSCRFITLVKDASMGAAEPVIAGQGGQMQTAAEKVNSALRTDFSNRAGFFDRNSDCNQDLSLGILGPPQLLMHTHVLSCDAYLWISLNVYRYPEICERPKQTNWRNG